MLVLDVVRNETGGMTGTVVTVLELLLVFTVLEPAHSVHLVLRERALVAEPFSSSG